MPSNKKTPNLFRGGADKENTGLSTETRHRAQPREVDEATVAEKRRKKEKRRRKKAKKAAQERAAAAVINDGDDEETIALKGA